MSTDFSRALPIKFVEPGALNQQMLTSPYFRFDSNYSGQLQVLNLGTSSIQAGAKMTFANSTVAPVRTPLTTVPAGGMVAIDLSSAADAVPDSVSSSAGRVDLIQTGAAGTVTATVTALGTTDNSGQVITPTPEPIPPLTLFPVGVAIIPGGCTTIDAITDGTLTNPCAPSADGCLGTAFSTFAPIGGQEYQTTMCVPIACSGSANDVQISWTCGTPLPNQPAPPPDQLTIPIVGDTGGAAVSTDRLDPRGITPFSVTLQNSATFPAATYQVNFIQAGGLSVSTQVQISTASGTLSGTAPANHTYLGPIKTVQVQVAGSTAPPLLQVHGTGLYYALPMPTAITSVSNSVPATGGSMTVTGSGFQSWPLSPPGSQSTTVYPIVIIGTAKKDNPVNQVAFTVNPAGFSGTSIPGLVGPKPKNVQNCTCQGTGGPCKLVSVINPGGSFTTNDNLTSSSPIVTITGPPAPTIATLTSSQGAQSNTLGIVTPVQIVNGISMPSSVVATITGTNLSRVQSVTFGGTQALFVVKSKGTQISAQVPAGCATTSATVSVSDNCNPAATAPVGWIYTASEPIQVLTAASPPNSAVTATFLVGPCDSMSITAPGETSGGQTPTVANCNYNGQYSCVVAVLSSPSFVVRPVLGINSATLGTIGWETDCNACLTAVGTFDLVATNTTNPKASALTVCVSTLPCGQ
jgi:hypothetical protein